MPLRFIPQVHRATHQIGLHIERLGPPGVTQPEAHILAHLASCGNATVAGLHQAFAHKRSTLTSILDRLEARGLIERTSDVRDRRTFVISLTRQGRALAKRVTSHLEAFEARVLRHASAAEIAACRRVLEAVADTI